MAARAGRGLGRVAHVTGLTCALLAAACGQALPDWEERPQPPPAVPLAPAAADEPLPLIGPAADAPPLRTLLVDTAVDLTADGVPERLQLSVDADRDARGRLMWDDGQPWRLVAYVGDAAFPLFDDYVQIGRLRVWVVTDVAGLPPQVTLLQETGAGLRLHTFAFDAARAAFARRTEFTLTGNVVYTSPVWE